MSQREERAADSRRLSAPRAIFMTDRSPSPLRKKSAACSDADSPAHSSKRIFPKSQAVLPQIKHQLQPSAFSPDRPSRPSQSFQAAYQAVDRCPLESYAASTKRGSNVFKSSLQRLGAIDRVSPDSRMRQLKDRVFVASMDLQDSKLKAAERSPEKLSCSTFSPQKANSSKGSVIQFHSRTLARKKSSKTSLFQIVSATEQPCNAVSADSSPNMPQARLAANARSLQTDSPLGLQSKPCFVPVSSNAFGDVAPALSFYQVSAINCKRRSEEQRFRGHLELLAATAKEVKQVAHSSSKELKKISAQGFLETNCSRQKRKQRIRTKLANALRKLLSANYSADLVGLAHQLEDFSRACGSAEEEKSFFQNVKRQENAAVSSSLVSNRRLIFACDSVATGLTSCFKPRTTCAARETTSSFWA